jgi:TrmH family RNA methyltransferase
MTLLEGPNLVGAARDAGCRIEAVFAREDDRTVGDEAVRVSEQVLRHLAGTVHPRGPLAVMGVPVSQPVERSCLVAFGVADPGNLGTLIRSAVAFGLDVVVTHESADPWSPKTLRAAAGGHFSTSIETEATLDDLRGRGFTIVGAVPRGGADPAVLGEIDRAAIIVGSEAHGFPLDVESDMEVTIPTAPGVESLNAAVAGSILAYVYSASRRS